MAVVGGASGETKKLSPVLKAGDESQRGGGMSSRHDSSRSLEEHGAADRSPNSSHHDALAGALHGFASIAASALSQQTHSSVSLDDHPATNAVNKQQQQVAAASMNATQVSPTLDATSTNTKSKHHQPAPPMPTAEEKCSTPAAAVAVTPAVSGETPKKKSPPPASTAHKEVLMPQQASVEAPVRSGGSETSVLGTAAAAASPSVTLGGGGSVKGGTGQSHVASAMPASPSTTSSPDLSAKKGVPHVYRDFVNIPDAHGMVRKKTGGVTQPFPEKLHEMLDTDEDASIVSWLPHGRAFIVRDPRLFTQIIMPKYFRQTKLTSFQRQLNLYGFRRLTQGADSGAYYHELFLRGRPLLSLRMQRQKVKGTGHKQPADVKTEPNFYAMTPSLKPQQSPSARTLQSNLPDQHPSGALSVAHGHSHPKESVLETSSRLPVQPPSVSATTLYPRSDDNAHSQSRPGGVHDLSPGLQGLHSAANLLKGMRSPFSLGQTSHKESNQRGSPSVTNGFSSSPAQTAYARNQNTSSKPQARPSFSSITAQYLLPKDRSTSLLGRVTRIDENILSGNRVDSASQSNSAPQSAFFWPPSRQQEPSNTKVQSPMTPEVVIESLRSNEPASTADVPASNCPNATSGKSDVKNTAVGGVTTPLPTATLTKNVENSISQEEAYVEKKVSKKGLEIEEA